MPSPSAQKDIVTAFVKRKPRRSSRTRFRRDLFHHCRSSVVSVAISVRGLSGMNSEFSRRYLGRHRRLDRAGGGDRLSGRSGSSASRRRKPAAVQQPTQRRRRRRAPRGPVIREVPELVSAGKAAGRPLRNALGHPYLACNGDVELKSSGAGTTMNGLAAPDVRAPAVRGRWHFWACFGPFSPNR